MCFSTGETESIVSFFFFFYLSFHRKHFAKCNPALPQVDCMVGRESLFKRSIILVKAWCHYESRILGSQYGLLATYALETMVLYIFQIFHASRDSPLAVGSKSCWLVP